MPNFMNVSAADVTQHIVPSSTSLSSFGRPDMLELQPTTGTQGIASESAKLHNTQQLQPSDIQNTKASISARLLTGGAHSQNNVAVDQDADLRINISCSPYDNIDQVHGLGETSNPRHTMLIDFEHSRDTAVTCYYRHCFHHRPVSAISMNLQVQSSIVSMALNDHDLNVVGLDSSDDPESTNETSLNNVSSANLPTYSSHQTYFHHLDRLERTWIGEPIAVDYGRTVMSSELLEVLKTL